MKLGGGGGANNGGTIPRKLYEAIPGERLSFSVQPRFTAAISLPPCAPELLDPASFAHRLLFVRNCFKERTCFEMRTTVFRPKKRWKWTAR